MIPIFERFLQRSRVRLLFRIIFFLVLFLFLLLFSYSISLFVIDKTLEQEKTIDFLQGKNGQESLFPFAYTTLELSHLDDVQKVMYSAEVLFYFSFFILLFFVIYYWKRKEELAKLFYLGGLVTLIVLGFIFIFSVFFFEQAFTVFHLLFFPQGNWIFPVDSLLIKTFPIEFFVKMSRMIFLLCLSLSILLAVVSRILLKNVWSERRRQT